VRTLLTYASGLAALAIVSMGQVHAACGGGGYSPPVKVATAVSVVPVMATAPTIRLEQPTAISAGLDSAHFDSKSAELNLSRSQAKDIADAKSDIKYEHSRLLKAQSRAQSKVDECEGNCATETRNLARATHAMESYNMNTQFELRLRSILRTSQAKAYFNS
jgi:hypothetical protein